MNTNDYLVSSDLITGVLASLMTKMNCKSEKTSQLWRPAVEGVVLSVVGRMAQSSLAGSWLSAKDKTGGTGEPYIRTEIARSSVAIAIAAAIYGYAMKNKNDAQYVSMIVSADVLGNELVKAFMANDTVWLAASKP